MSESTKNNAPTDPPKQHSLRYLFFVTTCIAVGVGLVRQPGIHPSFKSIGLGIINYWIAKGLFAMSVRLPNPWREIVFMIGLPFFVGAMYCVITGSAGLAVELFRSVAQ